MRIQIHSNPDRLKNQDRAVSLSNSTQKNEASDVNFKGSIFNISEKTKKKFYTSKGFQKFAKMSANPALLDATIVLGLASVARPLTILNMPKVDKRDKQYAASHSISTGIWGYATALLLFIPISNALKNVGERIKKNPEYLKNTFIKNNAQKRDAFNFVVGYGPKLLSTPIIGLVTISVIPFLMDLFFKKDKKIQPQNNDVSKNISKNAKTNQPSSNKKNLKNTAIQPNFSGKINLKDFFVKKIPEKIEPIIERMANNKLIIKVSESLAGASKEKSTFIRNIFTTGQAFLGTAVYVVSTMTNKKIEEENKKTLAVNQFLVWGLSAIATLFLTHGIQKTFDKIAADYKKYNIENLEENLETITKEKLKDLEKIKNKKIEKITPAIMQEVKLMQMEKFHFRKGNIAGNAPTMIAFAFIYRYLAPILATPLADVYKKHFSKDSLPKQTVKA